MNKTVVWIICCVNVLLVVFLAFRVLDDSPSPVRLAPAGDSVPPSPAEIDSASRAVRESLSEALSSGAGDLARLGARHPRLDASGWTDETRRTFELLLATVPSVSDPLHRMALRETVFDRFGGAPAAAAVLASHATDVLDDRSAPIAERRDVLVLLFRLLLRYPQNPDVPQSIRRIPSLLADRASDPVLLPTLVEGWGVLRARGMADRAARIFSVEDILALLDPPTENSGAFLRALALADQVAPDWGADAFRPWLEHTNTRIRDEAWRQFTRTADASSLSWLEEWRPADPDIDLLRLRALRTIAARLAKQEETDGAQGN